jgi:UPF0755 protein
MSIVEPPVVEEAPPAFEPEPRRRRRGLVKLLAFFIALALVFGGLGVYATSLARGSGPQHPVAVVIPEGASTAEIASILEARGVIKGAWLFKLVARLNGQAEVLKPGEYVLRTGMSFGEALAALEKGPTIVTFKVTIAEGKTVREIARIFEARTPIGAKAFLAAASSGRHRLPIMPAGSRNLEGLLFPKTYEIRPKGTADEAIQLLLDQFQNETRTLDFSRARALGVTPYQIVVIASLIEREAKVAQDRDKIAAVIYNRLKKGMRLQVDATVQYAIFLKTGHYDPNITTDDYRIDSPYNTYQIDGLPPAPIASPGVPALQAALNPAAVDYLYYVLINDRGEHAFARTYEEFLRLKSSRR